IGETMRTTSNCNVFMAQPGRTKSSSMLISIGSPDLYPPPIRAIWSGFLRFLRRR
ncbi:Threonyl-tRNA synthetase, partial [Candidatus Burkholderia humilis]